MRTSLGALVSSLALVAGGCATDGGGSQRAPLEATAPPRGFFETSPEHFDAVVRNAGLPTVVNVWASWCVPCRAEAPLFRTAARDYDGRVRFIGLNTQDTLEDARAFVREFRLPYANGFDPDADVMKHLEILGLPSTLFYKPDGELAFLHAGEIQRDDLEQKLRDLVLASKGSAG